MGNGRARLSVTFEPADMRQADVRHETAHLRCLAWCDICAAAMRRAACALSGAPAAGIVL